MYDENNPKMYLGALFPSMVKFRLAIRQWAINKEFELGLSKTDCRRYDGYYKGADDCPWHVDANKGLENAVRMLSLVLSISYE